MLPCDGRAICKDEAIEPATRLEKMLRLLAVLTMVMTVPQVISVWSHDNVGGVSLVSWIAYLISSVAWLVYGLQKHDRTIWLVCIGWIVLDVAIVAGILVRQ
jgi:uncharacterized protein with PQ loop repeat